MSVQGITARQIAKGMSYPFRIENGGVPWNLPSDDPSDDEIERAVAGAIWFVVMTPRGSMFTDRTFGSNAESLLFSPTNAATVDQIIETVTRAVETYVSYIKIIEASAAASPNSIDVTLSYVLKRTGRRREVQVSLPTQV